MNRRLYTVKHCFNDGETVYLKNSIRKVGTSHYVKPSKNVSGEKQKTLLMMSSANLFILHDVDKHYMSG